jgi:uncharacterized membrane protein
VSFPPLNFRQICVLGVILAVAAGMRFYRIGQASLWWDEVLGMEVAMGKGTVHDHFPDGVIRTDQPNVLNLADAAPWPRIWNNVQISTHPPIYYIVLRWWMDWLGTSAAAVRALSAIFSLAGIVVFFDLCRLLHGTRTALLAAAMMGLAVGQIDFGQDARSYPMLIFVALACADAIVRIEIGGLTKWRLVALAFFACALLLTHYFAFGMYGALILYALLRLRERRRIQVVSILVGVAIFVAIAWGRGFYWQLRTAPSLDPSYLREDRPHHAVQTLIRIVKLPMLFLFGDGDGELMPRAAHIVAALLVFLLPIILLRRRKALLIWVLWLWAVIGMAGVLDLLHQSILLQYTRYTVLAAPAVFAIFADQWPMRAKWEIAVPVLLIVSLIVADVSRLRQPVTANEDFQLLAQIIDSHAAPDELLVFYNDSQWVSPGAWYVCYKYYSPNSQHPWMTLHHPADAAALSQLSGHKILWLVGRQPEIDGPAVLPGWEPVEVWPTSAGRVCMMRNGG